MSTGYELHEAPPGQRTWLIAMRNFKDATRYSQGYSRENAMDLLDEMIESQIPESDEEQILSAVKELIAARHSLLAPDDYKGDL